MNNDFREYSDYLMHYGVPGMKWKHHHYVVDQPRQIGQRQAAIQSDFNRGERTAVVRRLQSDNNRDIQAARRPQETQNNFDRGVRAGQSNQRQREIQSHFDRGAQGTKPMFERSNSQNAHTTAKPSNRVSREYASEYTYNTTGRSDNESVGRMHKRLQKHGDANPNANLSTRRSRGLLTTFGVNHGGHHFSGETNQDQDHDRGYDDHHLTSRIVKNVRKRRR